MSSNFRNLDESWFEDITTLDDDGVYTSGIINDKQIVFQISASKSIDYYIKNVVDLVSLQSIPLQFLKLCYLNQKHCIWFENNAIHREILPAWIIIENNEFKECLWYDKGELRNDELFSLRKINSIDFLCHGIKQNKKTSYYLKNDELPLFIKKIIKHDY